MICEHCGKNNHNSATVCRSCGEKLHRSEVRIPLRYGRTHRPGTEETDSQQAASPDEYFFDPADYGDSDLYAAKRAKAAPEQEACFPQEILPAQEYIPSPQEYAPVPQGYDNAYNAYSYAGSHDAPARRKSRVPFLIVSHLTALLAVLCFILPFGEWVSYHYQLLDWSVSEDTLSLVELSKRFYENKSIVPMMTGVEDETLSSMVPDSVNQSFTQGRIAALAVAAVFLIALVLFVIFILAVLFHGRGVAAGFGITASLVYAGGCIGVMVALRILNNIVLEYDDVSWNIIQFKLLDMPYIGLGIAALIFLLCIVFAILGIGTGKRRR